jgi:hypothetical protein
MAIYSETFKENFGKTKRYAHTKCDTEGWVLTKRYSEGQKAYKWVSCYLYVALQDKMNNAIKHKENISDISEMWTLPKEGVATYIQKKQTEYQIRL